MEKRGEIPGAKTKERSYANAAPIDAVDKVRERVEALGYEWKKAIELAGVSRNVGYTLLRGEGSLASLRKVEDWVAREQAKQKTTAAKRSPRDEWMALADELESLGGDELANTIEGLQEYIRAEKRRRAALRKMFRATPDYEE